MSLFDPDDKPDYFTGDDSPGEDKARTINFAGDEAADEGSNSPAPPHRRSHKWLWILIFVALAGLGVTMWLRYFSPYVDNARMNIYVVSVERRGLIFKTYEADVISEAALTDTARVYSHRLNMSIENPTVAMELQSMQSTGKPLTISFKKYYGMLPWRGSSTEVITGIVKN